MSRLLLLNIEFRYSSSLVVIDCDRIINLMTFFFSRTWRDRELIGLLTGSRTWISMFFTALLFSFDVVCTRACLDKNKIYTTRRINELLSVPDKETLVIVKTKAAQFISVLYFFYFSSFCFSIASSNT